MLLKPLQRGKLPNVVFAIQEKDTLLYTFVLYFDCILLLYYFAFLACPWRFL